jgi:hypothetical protein
MKSNAGVFKKDSAERRAEKSAKKQRENAASQNSL